MNLMDDQRRSPSTEEVALDIGESLLAAAQAIDQAYGRLADAVLAWAYADEADGVGFGTDEFDPKKPGLCAMCLARKNHHAEGCPAGIALMAYRNRLSLKEPV